MASRPNSFKLEAKNVAPNKPKRTRRGNRRKSNVAPRISQPSQNDTSSFTSDDDDEDLVDITASIVAPKSNAFNENGVASKPKSRRRRGKGKRSNLASHNSRPGQNEASSSTSDDQDLVDYAHNFTIQPIQGNAICYNQRLSCTPIQLQTYLQNHTKLPVIFQTLFYTQHQLLQAQFEKMALTDETQQKQGSELALRALQKTNGLSPGKRERTRRKHEKKTLKTSTKFREYLTEQAVEEGLASGVFCKGFIRVNPKNAKESYMGNVDRTQTDYMVASILDRNRALDGDQVVLRHKPTQNGMKQTMEVIYITKKIHPRIAVGYLSLQTKDHALLTPRDHRIPKIQIPKISWPNGFASNAPDFADVLCVAQITDWDVLEHATGTIVEVLGKRADLKVESLAILKEFTLDTTPFAPEMRKYLPKSKQIDAKERAYRLDLTKECIFTIDPLTARDLDDAVGCKQLPNGNYEVGVHISDAAFYLAENTELDDLVRTKATSIYMTDQVFHMLPVELCLHCSLLPGVDKLSFSVIWELSPTGDIINKRITRSIINSCTQLAYEHAQKVIDEPNREFTRNDFPEIVNNFTPFDITQSISGLQSIAVHLRRRREEAGALKIDQIKIGFSLDSISGEPKEYWPCATKEANWLIEEFMLLANITVADWINCAFPELAFLRLHEPPKATMMAELKAKFETLGINIDFGSSLGLQQSLKTDENRLDDERRMVLNHLLAKPMQRARYFCAGAMQPNDSFDHYALSIPIYTHFTSPIRRYADIMVHRLLAASLRYTPTPNWDPEEVAMIAETCNRQKYNAKRASEASAELYLAHYVEQKKHIFERAVVADVKEKSVDCIIKSTGTVVRVYNNRVGNGGKWITQEMKKNGLKVTEVKVEFPARKNIPQSIVELKLFSVVLLELTRKPKSNKLEAKLMQ